MRGWAWVGMGVGMQWTMQHPQVSTCIVGCRTADEVNGVW